MARDAGETVAERTYVAIPLHFQPSIETVRDYAGDTVRIMKAQYNFDMTSYKPSRLELVDHVMNEWKAGGANANQVGKSMFAFGAYAGEVLRNAEPARWFKPEPGDDPDSFDDYPFLAVKLLDGRVWRPINLAFHFMWVKEPANFRRAFEAFLKSH
jgi:hypothetical protein